MRKCFHVMTSQWCYVFPGVFGLIWFVFWWFLSYPSPGKCPSITDAERIYIETTLSENSSLVPTKVCGEMALSLKSYVELTHGGRDQMDSISQTTLSSAFSWIKMSELRIKFRWSLLLRVQLLNGLVPSRRQAIIWTNVFSLPTHIHVCVTRPQCVNALINTCRYYNCYII